VSLGSFLFGRDVSVENIVRPVDRKGRREDYICHLETSKEALENPEL